ncbi:protein phosphatase 1 regulatory subunit 37 [Amia ocellicauda]|uniref:protein phosphatase 1 regulatory subunit 37 n=1 Tax=Amia ocellicauda TaxID=2972642 RepID=UPI00346399D0
MDSEEKELELSNVKAEKNNGDPTDCAEIIPRNSQQVMDADVGKLTVGAQVVDIAAHEVEGVCGRGEDQRLGDMGEMNGNDKTGVQVPHSADTALDNGPKDEQAGDGESGLELHISSVDDTNTGVDFTLEKTPALNDEPGASAGNPAVRDSSESGCLASVGDPAVISEAKEAVTLKEHATLPSSPLHQNDKLKAGGKRVTFPCDEDIVSGAVEPKDPWRHAQNVTVDEIITAYRQACQKLNCKPIPKVLKQIQEFKELTQRIDCLDLKGEKLDYKACEALEEVFKRVQFKVVDLEQTNLDEDGASALFDMIEYYESATHLNISFNKHIGTRGWQAAAHMMRKTSCLQYLNARNTPLLDHSAPFVARALRISSSLAVLHLENASLSGRPLMLLATALKMNMNLRELYLADNKLNGLQDSAQLGNLLKFNYYIQILDLRNNHIMDSGLAYLCEGLKEQRKGLVTLVLWNNQLTHNGMTYLAAALPCTQSLETLNLGHNSVGNEGVHKLKDGLIGNRSVLRLGLASTKLSCEGAVAVAEFIAESPRLLRLDLRENEIKTGGLMALSLALKVNTSLLRLDLDREPKRETVKSFIETQRALLAEIQNGCKRNFVLAKEKEETEQKMRHSASMPEITPEEDEEEAEEGGEEEEEEDEEDEEDEDGGGAEGAEVGQGEGEVEGEDREKEGGSYSEEGGEETRTRGEIDGGSATDCSHTNQESDSDTEEEEEEEDEEGQEAATAEQSTREVPPAQISPLISATPPVDRASSPLPGHPQTGAGTEVAVTLTQSASPASPHTPTLPGNERCISVSSPGRGHKIFVVTRVESPPEQLQLPPTLLPPQVKNAPPLPNPPTPVTDLGQLPPLDTSAGPVPVAVTSRDTPNTDECLLITTGSLPNGLKPEFACILPDLSEPPTPKVTSCSAEHELKCDKELEELLLEASLETVREAP